MVATREGPLPARGRATRGGPLPEREGGNVLLSVQNVMEEVQSNERGRERE